MHSLFAWKACQAAAKSVSSYGTSSLQGRRPKQEDRFYACEQLPGAPEPCAFFAVYDGHGGDRAATFATEMMHKSLVKSKAFKQKDHIKGLEQAFHEVETQFLGIAEREGLSDGTTAVVALIQDSVLTVAHVGDSRGVMCRGGVAVAITQDHKPEIEAERRRIESLGGFVSHVGCWRAMGILAMSRAIGDLFLKPYVSAQPEVRSVPLNDNDEFVVLASDGVFDVFDNDQVVRIVRAASSPQQAASLLTKSAFVAGSLDNLTAVVVALKGYKPHLDMAHSAAEPTARAPALLSEVSGRGHSAAASEFPRVCDGWQRGTSAPYNVVAADSAAAEAKCSVTAAVCHGTVGPLPIGCWWASHNFSRLLPDAVQQCGTPLPTERQEAVCQQADSHDDLAPWGRGLGAGGCRMTLALERRWDTWLDVQCA